MPKFCFPEPNKLRNVATTIASWQKVHGRHNLPWQNQHDPYRIWLAEVMLQQTQVVTVIDYYLKFLQRFPTLKALAQSPLEKVMPYWAGLGYYARARHLHQTAQIVYTQFNGQFPTTKEALQTLPGIGPSTAAAIAAFAFGQRVSILDGNVKRVFARYVGVREPIHLAATERFLWQLAKHIVAVSPNNLNMTAYTQGLMDLGALLCTRANPNCSACPLQKHCYAYKHQLTKTLPIPRARKQIPTRKKHMLIWVHNKKILLTRRPQKGIWGGLHSLPSFTNVKQLQQFCCQHAKEQPLKPQKQPHLIHRFTHFTLQIQPWSWANACVDNVQLDAGHYEWIDKTKMDEIALPTPIKKLLNKHISTKQNS